MTEVKKENFFIRSGRRTQKFYKDFIGEAKKVVWPTRKQLINNTAIVLAVVFFVGAIIWILDFIFESGLSLALNLLK